MSIRFDDRSAKIIWRAGDLFSANLGQVQWSKHGKWLTSAITGPPLPGYVSF